MLQRSTLLNVYFIVFFCGSTDTDIALLTRVFPATAFTICVIYLGSTPDSVSRFLTHYYHR